MIVDIEQSDLTSFLNTYERGADSIVFQLGSHSVKFGLASQLSPFVIPNLIAYKKFEKITEESKMEIDDDFKSAPCNSNLQQNPSYEISDAFLSNLLNIEQETIKKQMKLEQRLKTKKMPLNTKSYMGKNYENTEAEIPERKNFEGVPLWTTVFKKALAMSSDLNEDILENNYKWTSINSEPSFLIGREALTIYETEKYIFRRPIKYGFFNPEYSFQGVLDDLSKIIEFCVTNILQIKKKEYVNFNIVLILPDVYVKQQVKAMVNIFLRDLNFRSIFLHTESVMSAYGGALQSSCVVDIGSSKISVSCVDEGIIIEESMIRKNYGGDDITSLLYMMLSRKNLNLQNQKLNFPVEYFNINNPYHYRIFERIKEQECEFPSIQNPSSQFAPKSSKIWLHRKNKNTKIFNLTLTESIYVPPLCMLYPEILESFRNVTVPYLNCYNDIYSEIYTDPEDVMDDLIKNLITAEKNEKVEIVLVNNIKKDNIIYPDINNIISSVKKSKHNDEDDDSGSVSPSRSDENSSQLNNIEDEKIHRGKKNTYENMFKLLSIEDMISQSIMSVENPELRKKLSNAILLVGGGAKFKGMIDYLEDRLIDKLTVLDNEIDRIEIINFPTVDAKTLTWIGGTIIPKLESSKDMWIMRDRWLLDIEKIEDNKEKEVKDNASINLNDTESKKDDNVIGGAKDKIEKTKKKEKHLEGGVNLIREKCPFQW